MSVFYQQRFSDRYLVDSFVIPKRENRFIVAFSASYQFTNTIYIPQYMLIFSYLLRNKDGSFSAGVSMLTQAEYGINGFLVEIRKRWLIFCSRQHADTSRIWFKWFISWNPKKELKFKLAFAGALQGINSMKITQENQLCLHFKCLLAKSFACLNRAQVSPWNRNDLKHQGLTRAEL